MRCDFVVGQQVICIESGWYSIYGHDNLNPTPSVGETYTIAMIKADADGVWLHLRELPHGDVFAFEYFRPLEKRQIDISVFTELLQSKPKTRSLEPV